MANLVIAIADPARRGGISWVAILLQVPQACVLARGPLFQKIEGLLSGDRIRNVGEVDGADDLLRLHVREQFPERLTFNAVWDLYARVEGKPLWKLLADMEPEQIVRAIDFTYITDAVTREEALDLLKERA